MHKTHKGGPRFILLRSPCQLSAQSLYWPQVPMSTSKIISETLRSFGPYLRHKETARSSSCSCRSERTRISKTVAAFQR